MATDSQSVIVQDPEILSGQPVFRGTLREMRVLIDECLPDCKGSVKREDQRCGSFLGCELQGFPDWHECESRVA
jgi:hypothetical protein